MGVFTDAYDAMVLSLPESLRVFPPLILFSILIALYGIFVWVFYRFLAKRDLIKLDLKKYNVFEHSAFIKIFATFFYILEFAIILPFVIVFWFTVLSILLLVLAKDQPTTTILLISAAIIGGVRITAYYKEDLSRDMAKMFPFTLLSVAILSPGFFEVSSTIAKLNALPSLFSEILSFAVFLIALEVVLRLFFLAFSLITSSSNSDEGEEKS